MSESKDYQTLKKHALEPLDRIDRIENFLVIGMFDSNLCVEGAEVWVEFKSPVEPKKPTTALFGSNHKLSQEQKNWALRQRNAGGKCYILIATDKRWMLIDGIHADGLNEATVGELIKWSKWHATKPIKKPQWKLLRLALKT
ncbi:MAG TPA: hypothetical protein VIY48_04650 [Candidatus Paceibacterota bacterium]